jgi:hypothetical protein
MLFLARSQAGDEGEQPMSGKINLESVTFPNVTFINTDAPDPGFEEAKETAMRVAKRYDSDPMLLSWYDSKTGQESPSVSCEGDEPGWVNYAKSHGGCFTVNINHGQYMFIFRCEHDFK